MPTFSHGSSAGVLANGWDISTYLKNADVAATADVADTSTLQSVAKTYIAGLKDGMFTAAGLFAGTVGAIDQIFNAALGTAGSKITYWPTNDTVSNPGYGLNAQETSYKVSAPVSDVVSVSIDAQASNGAEQLYSLAAGTATIWGGAAAGTVTGGTVNYGTATTAGGVIYVQCTALSGVATYVVTLDDSADGSTFAGTVLSISGTITTANTSLRMAAAGTVRQYTRVRVVRSGAGTASLSIGLGRIPNL